jgi:hypothetical protein
MSTLKLVTSTSTLNPNLWDLEIDDSGQLILLNGATDSQDYATEVLQRVLTRLVLHRGEWYLDQRLGVPWREYLWLPTTTEAQAAAVLRQAVEGTPGVESVSILSVVFDDAHQTLELAFEAMTDQQTVITTATLDTPFILEAPNG